MAVLTQKSNKLKYALATGAIDFSSDDFRIILMESGFVFDPDTHHGYADVSGSELANGNGYTTAGELLVLDGVTENDTENYTQVTFDPISWTGSGTGIPASPGAIIYDDTDATTPKAVVMYIDFGGEVTTGDGDDFIVSAITIRVL